MTAAWYAMVFSLYGGNVMPRNEMANVGIELITIFMTNSIRWFALTNQEYEY